MKTKGTKNLIITAHPDDEVIFFGGLILTYPDNQWDIFCVTDANADGMGELRSEQFRKSCIYLGANVFEQWNFPDVYEERLDIQKLVDKFVQFENYDQVFTHGILGEYGHPHHQDVSFAVHSFFQNKHIPIFSPSHNIFPEFLVTLSESVFNQKRRILLDIYGSEYNRFANVLPLALSEGYVQLQYSEVEHLYRYFLKDKKELDPTLLISYKDFYDHICKVLGPGRKRTF